MVSGCLYHRSDFSIDKPFVVQHLTDMRQIIDLIDLSRSLMVHTTGKSGQLRHRNYGDFIDPWRMIEYHSTRWERDDLRKESKEKSRSFLAYVRKAT